MNNNHNDTNDTVDGTFFGSSFGEHAMCILTSTENWGLLEDLLTDERQPVRANSWLEDTLSIIESWLEEVLNGKPEK